MPPLEPAVDSKSLQGNGTENLPTEGGLVSSESLTTEPSTKDIKEPPPEWLDILGNGLLKKTVNNFFCFLALQTCSICIIQVCDILSVEDIFLENIYHVKVILL